MRYIDDKIMDRMQIFGKDDRKAIMDAAQKAGLTLEKNISFASEDIKDRNAEFSNLRRLKNPNDFLIDNNEIEYTVKIGSGSSGTVYRGLYKNTVVAIKVLKPGSSKRETEEFKKEFELMSQIQYPYIVFFFGVCIEPRMCMVMEYCSRQSLWHVLNDSSLDFDWNQSLAFSLDIVRAVDFLHSHDPVIVHRDIKTLNFMITKNWFIKLGDFGLSKKMDGRANTSMGTLVYSAPELFFGDPYTVKSDIYSLAFVFWEIMYTCTKRQYQRPFAEFPFDFDFQIQIKTAKEKLRPSFPPHVPQKYIDLIQELWKPNPKDRPTSKELLYQIEKLRQDYENDPYSWETHRDPPLLKPEEV